MLSEFVFCKFWKLKCASERSMKRCWTLSWNLPQRTSEALWFHLAFQSFPVKKQQQNRLIKTHIKKIHWAAGGSFLPGRTWQSSRKRVARQPKTPRQSCATVSGVFPLRCPATLVADISTMQRHGWWGTTIRNERFESCGQKFDLSACRTVPQNMATDKEVAEWRHLQPESGSPLASAGGRRCADAWRDTGIPVVQCKSKTSTAAATGADMRVVGTV